MGIIPVDPLACRCVEDHRYAAINPRLPVDESSSADGDGLRRRVLVRPAALERTIPRRFTRGDQRHMVGRSGARSEYPNRRCTKISEQVRLVEEYLRSSGKKPVRLSERPSPHRTRSCFIRHRRRRRRADAGMSFTTRRSMRRGHAGVDRIVHLHKRDYVDCFVRLA